MGFQKGATCCYCCEEFCCGRFLTILLRLHFKSRNTFFLLEEQHPSTLCVLFFSEICCFEIHQITLFWKKICILFALFFAPCYSSEMFWFKGQRGGCEEGVLLGWKLNLKQSSYLKWVSSKIFPLVGTSFVCSSILVYHFCLHVVHFCSTWMTSCVQFKK